MGEPIYYDKVPASENLLGVIDHAIRVGDRIIGIAGDVTEQRVVQCIEPDGSRRDLSKPAHFHGPSVRPDGMAFLVASHDGRLHEGTIDGHGLATVYQGKGPFWSVCALSTRHAVLDVSSELVLLERPEGSTMGTVFAVKQHIAGYDFPSLRRLADPRFLYVDTSDNAALFALKDGRLHVVEGFPDTSKRGLRITNGRAFLYEAKNYDRWELLDWDAAYDEL